MSINTNLDISGSNIHDTSRKRALDEDPKRLAET